MECERTMKRLKLKIPVATIIFCAAALTGCWKDNPSNGDAYPVGDKVGPVSESPFVYKPS